MLNRTYALKIKQLRPPTSSLMFRRAANTISVQSTNTMPIANDSKRPEVRPQYPLLDTKFDQHRIAYQYRHTLELLRGYLVYRLFSINYLVNNQDKVNVDLTHTGAQRRMICFI